MNIFLLRCIAFWLALATLAAASVDTSATRIKELTQGFREHRILAKPKSSFRETAELAERREGIRLRKRFSRLGDLRVLDLDDADSADAAIARLRASGRYEYVERDHLRYPSVIPNDPAFSEQWSLRNTGTAGADIAATTGWNTLTDASGVIVAIVDSGIRATHQDLAANLWSSPTGTHGINALLGKTASGYTNPADDVGHGTHVAGIIGAVGNNNVGVSGVAWNVQLMALKFLSPDNGSVSDSIECIEYAIAHGAHIINASYGSNTYSEFERFALRAARNAGIIVVVAAGNEASDNDTIPTYPANYQLDNLVVVASTTRTDALATTSNFGGSVDLAAPGHEIRSTYYSSDSSYHTLGGTSMAAPHVSGALALLKARYPNDTYRQLINRLLRAVAKIPSLNGKVQTGGRLNLAAALASTDNRPFNDNFSARAALSGSNLRIRSNNTGATLDSGEPAHAGTAGGASLWWSWTAPATTSVALDTAGSDYDTVLAVYTGNSLGSLSPVGSNDNATSDTTTSRLNLNVSAGTTYLIAIDGKNGASGFTTLKLGAVPTHDTFANAKTVTGVSVRETASTLNASRESGEPDPTGKAAGHSVWYQWTAPSTGTYSLAAFATTTDTLAAVYTGNSVTSLTTIASNDNNRNGTNTDALVTFTATAGVTYRFQIDHTATSSSPDGGDFILTLTDSLWEFPADDEITSSPAVSGDGTVFVGSVDGYVYAINPDGSRKWRTNSAIIGNAEGFDGASPALAADGTLYIGSVGNSLLALNSLTGDIKWSRNGGSPIYSTPAVAANGTVYYRNETKLHALNPAGTPQWDFTLNTAAAAGTYCSPVIGTDGTIYIGTTDGSFFALTDNGGSATLKWTYAADGDIYTTPAIGHDGTLYFGTLAGNFYAITPGATGATTKWSIALPKFEGSDNSISSSPALGVDGTIYFAAYDHKLYALNPSTGAIKWSYTLGDEVRASSPAIAADGTIYVGAYDGLIYALNPNGTLRRIFPTALRIRSSPAIAGTRLYIGSADAKLHAFDLGQSAAPSDWPMFRQSPARTGRAAPASGIVTEPTHQTAAAGGGITLVAAAAGTPAPTFQWQRNGTNLAGATSPSLTLSNLQPAHTGLYTATAANPSATWTTRAAIVGITTSQKVIGAAIEYGTPNIVHPNGNVFDQILLTGPAAAITAEHSPDPALNQITRLSYIDLDDDIVQVEFSGPGTLSLVLDNPSAPARPGHYNQAVDYVKGHASIVIADATARTNVSVFSVGRATAFDPRGTFNFLEPVSDTNIPANNTNPIFEGHASTAYDGIADIAFIAIASVDGKFGGVRTANANYFAGKSLTGLYAPGIAFEGPVYLGDINAFDSATPVLVVGSVSDARITGGSLAQSNGESVRVSGLTQLKFTAGSDSHGNPLPARNNQAVLRENQTDVTAQIVVNPAP